MIDEVKERRMTYKELAAALLRELGGFSNALGYETDAKIKRAIDRAIEKYRKEMATGVLTNVNYVKSSPGEGSVVDDAEG